MSRRYIFTIQIQDLIWTSFLQTMNGYQSTREVFHWILTPDLSTWKLPTTVTKITLPIKDT